MTCEHCGSLDYRVIKTYRGDNYDLREAFCPVCLRVFYQKIEKISDKEFKDLRENERNNRKIITAIRKQAQNNI